MSEQTTIGTRPHQVLGPTGGVPDDPWAGDAGGGLVQVATGLYSERVAVAGMTVAAIRERFADRLDIDPQAMPVLDGRRVADESTAVAPGQHLAFVRHAGEKGRGH